MELKQIHNITFNTQETVVSASLNSADEWILLLSSGQVVQFNVEDSSNKLLFDINNDFTYKDGGFDIAAPCSIYTLGDIVVLVNDYKLHGYVHYPGNYHRLHIWRGEYHADITRFPIALYKSDIGIPHLIYGVDWNHLQIMNLDTRQVLTAAKSLIEENAEERHIEFYKQNTEENKLPWPTPYNYFFGGLLMSPDNNHFLSKGWVWGSADSYNVYNVADFISNCRITDKNIGCWEHENRAACWIDNETVAVAYNPFIDDDSTKGEPIEIRFYDISSQETVEAKRFIIGKNLPMPNDIFYIKRLNVIIAVYAENGIIAYNANGDVLLRDDASPNKFYPEHELFLSFSHQTVSVFQLRVSEVE